MTEKKKYANTLLIKKILEGFRMRQCYTCYRYFPECAYYNTMTENITDNVQKGIKDMPPLCQKYENRFTRNKGD
ncbi:MAG: hypothetical protein RBR14_06445 [Candidatus Cloacimonas acidaminovorans]|nr:hypothetical protein [Candidatus Cloacimonas acidaminovorans]